jgi:flagellar basal body rod protein FlgF
MAQHDYNLANQSGADFRADLNNALSAIATNNSGANQPSTTFAYEWWIDTTNNVY